MFAREYPVIARMESQLRLWREPSDPRSIFLECYTLMTRNMLLAVDEGRFNDGVWVSALLDRFAGYYFDALDVYSRSPDDTPKVWRHTFEVACRTGLHSVQHLFLGVNAHIRFDLVLTLTAMLRDEWPGLTDTERQMRYEDHTRVNQIIYETINEVQDTVIERHSPEMSLVDTAMFGLDEWLIFRMISNWRDQTWQQAQALMGCAAQGESDELVRGIEARVLLHAEALLGQHGIRGLLDLL